MRATRGAPVPEPAWPHAMHSILWHNPFRSVRLERAPGRPIFIVALAVYVGINLSMVLTWDVVDGHVRDWDTWRALPTALAEGTLYALETELPYPYSPLFAPVMAGIGIIGLIPWAAISCASLLLLRDWRLIVLVVVSIGFWTNVAGGNTFTFVLVSAALALAGSRRAAIVFLVLTMLMPRPVQLPIAAVLIWKMQDIRLPVAVIFLAQGVAVLLTGYADDWTGAVLAQTIPPWNLGPSRWIGGLWLPIGAVLGAFLWWRRRPGWAGLAFSSYWVPHYLLMPLAEQRYDTHTMSALAGLAVIQYAFAALQ